MDPESYANPLVRWLRRLRDFGLENASRRFYSKYMGIVESNADVQGQARVKVSCEAATGNKNPIELWAHPSVEFAGRDYGMYFPPAEGARVWVWFDHGDPKIPKYSGAFFQNTGDEKKIATSYIPAEFKTHVAEDNTAEAVHTRGVKTPRGHGLLFEDKSDAEGPSVDDPSADVAGTRVEVWSGFQRLGTEGQPAERRNQILMVDGADDPGIAVRTYDGPFFVMRSRPDLNEIKAETPAGYKLHILEGEKKIVLLTPGEFGATIDEENKLVEFFTGSDRGIEASDTDRTVRVRDPQGNFVLLSDDGVKVNAATGNIVVASIGAVQISGVAIEVRGSGNAITQIAGTSTNIFTGLVTETFNGALTQVVNGLLSITVTLAKLMSTTGAAKSIEIGDVSGDKYYLVDQRFFNLYNEHTHTDSMAGTTTKPLTPYQAAVFAQTTKVLAGN